jgi:hypothetical protein
VVVDSGAESLQVSRSGELSGAQIGERLCSPASESPYGGSPVSAPVDTLRLHGTEDA